MRYQTRVTGSPYLPEEDTLRSTYTRYIYAIGTMGSTNLLSAAAGHRWCTAKVSRSLLLSLRSLFLSASYVHALCAQRTSLLPLLGLPQTLCISVLLTLGLLLLAISRCYIFISSNFCAISPTIIVVVVFLVVAVVWDIAKCLFAMGSRVTLSFFTLVGSSVTNWTLFRDDPKSPERERKVTKSRVGRRRERKRKLKIKNKKLKEVRGKRGKESQSFKGGVVGFDLLSVSASVISFSLFRLLGCIGSNVTFEAKRVRHDREEIRGQI